MGSGSYTHTRRSTNVSPDVEVNLPGILPPSLTGPPLVEVSPDIDIYSVGFDAVWELDLWGKKRRRIEAMAASLKATYAGYDDIMVSLAGEVAAAYFQRKAIAQRLSALRENTKVMEDFQALAEERFESGESPETDVQLARTLVATVAVGIPRLEYALRQTENALCILLSEAPRALDDRLSEAGPIPPPPIGLAVGIPTDLLRRRPDVRAAERLAHAECARIGLTKAAILPSFNLLGAFGWSASNSGDLFDSASRTWSYGGLLKATPLINYPLTIERVRMADARFEEAMAQYQAAALNAAREVDDAMTSVIKVQEQKTILREGSEAAARSAELAVAAYKEGKVIVSVPLVALAFKANLQDQAIGAQGDELTSFVAVYKSLGGGWETRRQEELVPEHIRERMKERIDWRSFSGKSDLRTVREEPPSQTADRD
jgi:NodT family efflux transporter outer membrane factor (OMF) lipoprotein